MIMRVIMTRYRDLIDRTHVFRAPEEGYDDVENAENMNEDHDLALGSLKDQSELKNAIRNDELVLHYQPIIHLQQKKLAGYEALMRWEHPEKGMMSPGLFIPIAEETGLITQLTSWALNQACQTVNSIQKERREDISTGVPLFISVNFSVKDFAQDGIFENIVSVINEHQTKPEQLHLEITESLLMAEPEQAQRVLAACRNIGLHTSIDDFGSGYSSLSYLHNFPINTLKIDQSFVRSLNTNETSLVLVKSIIGLARNLGMVVIAEGIETEKEAILLRDLGCDMGQGYWFAKPMPLDAAHNFAQEWTPSEF